MNTTEKHINYGIEILRALMCFGVICLHFYNRNCPSNIVFDSFFHYAPNAVPIFMLISFILLKKLYIHTDIQTVTKRIWRLYLPQLAWAIIYWSVYMLADFVFNRELVDGITPLGWQLLTGHSPQLNPSMWFQTDLIVLTLIICVPLFWTTSKKAMWLYGCLFVVSLLLQYTGINYSAFSGMRFELKYPLGRLIETLPYAVIGFILVSTSVLDRLREKNINDMRTENRIERKQYILQLCYWKGLVMYEVINGVR